MLRNMLWRSGCLREEAEASLCREMERNRGEKIPFFQVHV
jgi:hypothetical protein